MKYRKGKNWKNGFLCQLANPASVSLDQSWIRLIQVIAVFWDLLRKHGQRNVITLCSFCLLRVGLSMQINIPSKILRVFLWMRFFSTIVKWPSKNSSFSLSVALSWSTPKTSKKKIVGKLSILEYAHEEQTTYWFGDF